MLNDIKLQGRLTATPELRYTQSGTAVASFTLAVERDFSNEGEKQTDFISIVAWKQTAEFASKYFDKGSMCIVSGRLQMRDWQDKEGNKRRAYEVIADRLYFSGDKHTDTGNASAPRPAGRALDVNNDEPKSSAFSEIGNGDGDLPF